MCQVLISFYQELHAGGARIIPNFVDDGAAAWRGEVVGQGDAARLSLFSLCGPRDG